MLNLINFQYREWVRATLHTYCQACTERLIAAVMDGENGDSACVTYNLNYYLNTMSDVVKDLRFEDKDKKLFKKCMA